MDRRYGWRRARAIQIALMATVLGLGWNLGLLAQPVTVETEPNGSAVTATPLDVSSGYAVISGTIAPTADTDYYSFSAPANSRVWILADTGGLAGGGATSRDSFISLLAANGSTILEADDDDGSGTGCDTTLETAFASAIAGRLLVEGGTYFVSVNEFNHAGVIDPYLLFLVVSQGPPLPEAEANNTPATANPIVDESHAIGVVSGNISSVGDVDVFSIQVQPGTKVHISLDADPERDGSGSDLGLDLIATNGTDVLLSANSSRDEPDAAEAFCFTAETIGTYYVRVRHFENGTGTYVLMAGSPPRGSIEFSSSVYPNVEGASPATIQVVRTGNTSGIATVRFGTANGTAVAPSDYTTNGAVLTFQSGVSIQTFTIALTGDVTAEANETVLLTLQSPTGAVLGGVTNAVLVIVDDDEATNHTVATATRLDVRTTYSSAKGTLGAAPVMISPAGDDDWYSFAAPAGARAWIFVDTGGTPGPASMTRDSRLTLLAADGLRVIEEDDDDGSGNGCGPLMDEEGGQASAIAGCSLAGGTYYVQVSAFSEDQIIEPYDLFVAVTSEPALSEVEPNDTVSPANDIVTESVAVGYRLGQLGVGGDSDLYSVTATVGSVIFISADCDPYRSTSGTDLVVELLGTNGTTVLFSADSSGSEAAAAEAFCFRITQTGTYFVRVKHYLPEGTGPYGLMVARSPDETEPNDTSATALRLNLAGRAAPTGAISPGGDSDIYVFTANAGEQLWASVDTGGDQRAGANSRDSMLALLAANGTTVIEQDSDDGSGNGGDTTLESGTASAICGLTLTAGGTYYLRVRGQSGSLVINPYRLFVALSPALATAEIESNNTPATAEPLLTLTKALETRQAAIGNAGDVDCYALMAAGGDVIDVAVNGDPERDGIGTDARVELLAPGGQTLFSANSSGVGSVGEPPGEAFWFRVVTNGVYVVRISHVSGSGTGTYRVLASRDRTALQIVGADRVGFGRRLGLTTMPGRKYGIEFLSTLGGEASWLGLPDTILGTGNVEYYLDSSSTGASNLYYRAVQVP